MPISILGSSRMYDATLAWQRWIDAAVIIADLRHRIGSAPWPARRDLQAKLTLLGTRKQRLEQAEVTNRRSGRSRPDHEALAEQWFEDADYLGNEVTWAMLSR